MKQFAFAITTALLGTLLFASTAFASTTNCQPIYGGGQTCVTGGTIQINKMVQNPQGGMVDNLGVNDPHFAPTQTVTFQIIVTNTGSSAIANTVVKDIFPQFVSFVAGPGNWDGNSNTLTFNVSTLQAGESRTYTVQGLVANANAFGNQNMVCVINQATATSDSNGGNAQDNSQFCIQPNIPTTLTTQTPQTASTTKGGLPIFPSPSITTTPPTGPEALPLLAMIPTGAFGYLLRKKSLKMNGGEK